MGICIIAKNVIKAYMNPYMRNPFLF